MGRFSIPTPPTPVILAVDRLSAWSGKLFAWTGVLLALIAQTPKEKLDAYLDKRWEAPANATAELVKALEALKAEQATLEQDKAANKDRQD